MIGILLCAVLLTHVHTLDTQRWVYKYSVNIYYMQNTAFVFNNSVSFLTIYFVLSILSVQSLLYSKLSGKAAHFLVFIFYCIYFLSYFLHVILIYMYMYIHTIHVLHLFSFLLHLFLFLCLVFHFFVLYVIYFLNIFSVMLITLHTLLILQFI